MVRDARTRARISAEASAWLARLHGPGRSARTDDAFHSWLNADPAHQRAFERATELWDMLPGAARLSDAETAVPARAWFRPLYALAAVLVAAVLAGGSYLWLSQTPAIVTRPGQQQVLTLEDGSRIALNTDSRVSVHYSAHERRVRLERGEGLFDVAHNPARPFIVEAGDERVRALGTSFVVRRDMDHLAVTLVHGSVEVSRQEDTHAVRQTILAPGQRFQIVGAALGRVDRPSLDAVTAWRHGEVVFDDTRLGDAVAEINRYGGTPVTVPDAGVADIRVSGVFETSDANEFAVAVAQLHRLRLVRNPDSFELQR